MNARRKLIAELSEDSMGGIATLHDVERAEQLVDAHRAEVARETRLADAAYFAWQRLARDRVVNDFDRGRRAAEGCVVEELRGRAGSGGAVAVPDFFQPGRTYTAVAQPFTFRCVTYEVWSDGSLRALGRSAWTERAELHWIATEFAVEDWAGGAWGGWTDVTGEVAS